MTDTVLTRRARATGVVKESHEVMGGGAVKNQYRLMTPEAVSTITEYGSDQGLRTSVIEFTKAAHLITRAGAGDDGHGNLKLATFPKGRIWVHGAAGTLTVVDVSDSANVADTGSGDYSFGTTATSDCTLNGTDVNLGPSAALIDPFVAGVGAANASSILAAAATFDGTSTAVPVYLNIIFDAGDVTTGNGTADITGKIIIKWSYLALDI